MKEIITDMWSVGWLGRSFLLHLVFTLLLIPLGIHAKIEESKQWEEFKITHECKITAHKKGHVSWICNDGVTYWR